VAGHSTLEERELRMALVMTGGVSLAVWMGGVSAEIYRAVKQDGPYEDLCAFTATRVAVDIISGSSAGGLNGALLGAATSGPCAGERWA
jgi:predicted acylesterase/phospholipase RssA